jgi:hypothetical protein
MKERRNKGRGGKEGWRRVGERKKGREEVRGGAKEGKVTDCVFLSLHCDLSQSLIKNPFLYIYIFIIPAFIYS